MKSYSYSRPHHSKTHLRGIWTFLAIFMLLASLIPALANPLAAQSDGDQAQDPTATEQTGDQPPDGEQPPDGGKRRKGRLTTSPCRSRGISRLFSSSQDQLR